MYIEKLLAVEPRDAVIAGLIGCHRSAVGHWRAGRNGHSATSEKRAKRALRMYETENETPEPTPEPADGPLLIIEDSERARRLLSAVNIEWIEV